MGSGMLARHLLSEIRWQLTNLSPSLRAQVQAATQEATVSLGKRAHHAVCGSRCLKQNIKATTSDFWEQPKHGQQAIGHYNLSHSKRGWLAPQVIALVDMDLSGAGMAEEPASTSSDAEAAAIRIVSNLPAALRGSPDELQANPSGGIDVEAGFSEDESDEDCDEDEDIGIGGLAEDMAVLEEELEHGAWDGPAPAGFPDYLHGVYLLHQLLDRVILLLCLAGKCIGTQAQHILLLQAE